MLLLRLRARAGWTEEKQAIPAQVPWAAGGAPARGSGGRGCEGPGPCCQRSPGDWEGQRLCTSQLGFMAQVPRSGMLKEEARCPGSVPVLPTTRWLSSLTSLGLSVPIYRSGITVLSNLEVREHLLILYQCMGKQLQKNEVQESLLEPQSDSEGLWSFSPHCRL